MRTERVGEIYIQTITGKTNLGMVIGFDEPVEKIVEAAIKDLILAFESLYGSCVFVVKASCGESLESLELGERRHIRRVHLYDENLVNLHTLDVYALSSVVPRKDPEGVNPIYGTPGVEIQIEVTEFGS